MYNFFEALSELDKIYDKKKVCPDCGKEICKCRSKGLIKEDNAVSAKDAKDVMTRAIANWDDDKNLKKATGDKFYVVKASWYGMSTKLSSRIEGHFRNYKDALNLYENQISEYAEEFLTGLDDDEYTIEEKVDYKGYKNYYRCSFHNDDTNSSYEFTISEVDANSDAVWATLLEKANLKEDADAEEASIEEATFGEAEVKDIINNIVEEIKKAIKSKDKDNEKIDEVVLDKLAEIFPEEDSEEDESEELTEAIEDTLYIVKTAEYSFGSGVDTKIIGTFKNYKDALNLYKKTVSDYSKYISEDEDYEEEEEVDYNGYKNYYCYRSFEEKDDTFECTVSEIKVK